MTGAVTCAAGLLLTTAGPSAPEALRRITDPATGVHGAVADLAALLAWLCLAWCALGTALAVATQLPGAAGRVAGWLGRRLLPAVLRRGLEAALGISVATATLAPAVLATPAAAVPTPIATPATSPVPVPPDLPAAEPAPATVPVESPVSSTAPGPGDPAAPAPAGSIVVVVRPGDCLWHIAADYLGDEPTAAQVDRSWRRWYAATRAVVGPNPHLIHPGQRLAPPPGAGSLIAPDAGAPS